MTNPGLRWFEQRKEFVPQKREGTVEVPDLFTRCPSCNETVYNEVLTEHQEVCPLCGHHFKIEALPRLLHLCDPGSLTVHDQHLVPTDTLAFVDSKPYGKRIADARRSTGVNDAFLSVSAEIHGIPVEVGTFDFRYMGGSMGSVVGECITRLYERAAERRRPAIVISASGGARMQEGVLSLMQMAKTCAALARLKDDARMPYISILTHPTTGGVAASFAMLGDLILAEPGALVGFAGPRVIEQTIGQALPPGFQTSEYLLEHGMVDRIVRREDLRPEVARVLRLLLRLPAPASDSPPSPQKVNLARRSDPAVAEGTTKADFSS
jgi:acetyl-CoA carboxylase carboxyl transferase subunit beta